MRTYHSSFVEHCKESHSLPDVCCPEPGIEFTKEEIKALWRILSHHYISYEDISVIEVVRKISRIINELVK